MRMHHLTSKQLKEINDKYADAVLENTREVITHEMVKCSTLALIKVLHDELGWGKVRVERLLKQYNEVFEAYCEGYLEMDDLSQVAKEIGVEL